MCPAPTLPAVELADDRLDRGPWVYGRRVRTPRQDIAPGSLVEVLDASDRFVGHALYNPHSDIRLRWLSRGRRTDLDKPERFLLARLKAADDLRRKALRLPEFTDAYRICHGEGDDLPGLVVDRLGPFLVCEHHALGFWNLRGEVERALLQLYPSAEVVHRVPNSALGSEGFSDAERAAAEAAGELTREVEITEHGIVYPLLPGKGHKTGFFCDQRENRRHFGSMARGRRVYDLCCNTGGFGLHAARGGARYVLSLDLDEVVLERAHGAAARNQLEVDFAHADAFHALRGLIDAGKRAELVVLDPPKLAMGKSRLEDALKKYHDLNALALSVLEPGGLLMTFSCSGALDTSGFLGAVFSSARRAGREIRLLEVLGPGPDHPQRPDHPRSRYLKGALVAAD